MCWCERRFGLFIGFGVAVGGVVYGRTSVPGRGFGCWCFTGKGYCGDGRVAGSGGGGRGRRRGCGCRGWWHRVMGWAERGFFAVRSGVGGPDPVAGGVFGGRGVCVVVVDRGVRCACGVGAMGLEVVRALAGVGVLSVAGGGPRARASGAGIGWFALGAGGVRRGAVVLLEGAGVDEGVGVGSGGKIGEFGVGGDVGAIRADGARLSKGVGLGVGAATKAAMSAVFGMSTACWSSRLG